MEAPRLRGGGLGELRGHNRAAVLRALLECGPLSRTDLRQVVGLPASVLSYISTELLEAGLIEEQAMNGTMRGPDNGVVAGANGTVPGGERQRRGRQPIPLSLVPFGRETPRCAVSVHIGATRIATGLVDLRARLIARRELRIDHAAWGPDPGALAEAVASEVAALLAEHRVPRSAVLGAGVGVAGWIDGAHGVVRRQAQLGWKEVPLADLLTRALAMPVVVDDHVRAIAAAEAWFGKGRGAATLSVLFVGAEVGCSNVIGRQVHHGHHAAAGSVGFLPAWPAAWPVREGAESRAKRPSAQHTATLSLEAAASETAVFEAALQVAQRTPDGVVAHWVAGASSGGQPTTDSLAALAQRTDDADARALLQQRADALAPFVAHVLGAVDPELLVVAGSMALDTGLYQLQLLRDALVAHAPGLGERLPALEPSAFGRDALAVSAGALVLREMYTAPLAAYGDARVSGEIRRRAFSTMAP